VDLDRPEHPPILIVSDGTGASAERLVRSMLVQFGDANVPLITLPGVDRTDAIDHAIDTARRRRAIMVVHTILAPELRFHLQARCADVGLASVDLTGALLEGLSRHLGKPSRYRPGLYRRLHREYFQRVEAIDFAIGHDDGQNPDTLPAAEVVLLGVSRSGKTPLSMYLAMQGWKVANLPLVPDADPPRQLDLCDHRRLVGLTITSELLVQHRTHRQASLGTLPARYAEPSRVYHEVEAARAFFRLRHIPTVDVTNKPIEASAREVITRVTRRLGLADLPGQEL